MSTKRRLEAARDRLLEMHSDRSGMARRLHRPPLLEREWRGEMRRPGLAGQLERIRREAADGCELSQTFLSAWEETFALCERLRHMRPPERAADFDPTRERYWRIDLPPPTAHSAEGPPSNWEDWDEEEDDWNGWEEG